MAMRQNLWQAFLELIPKPFRNKYVLVLTIFLVIMLVFDTANICTQVQLSNTVRNLKSDKVYYEEKIKEAEESKKDLEQNMEKFAREKYHMKKKNEDVFIIEKQEE